jgi:hypothetical protein
LLPEAALYGLADDIRHGSAAAADEECRDVRLRPEGEVARETPAILVSNRTT